MENEKVFILVVDNGESYADNSTWNAGVFITLESAIQFLKTSNEIPSACYDASIEIWNSATNTREKSLEFERRESGWCGWNRERQAMEVV